MNTTWLPMVRKKHPISPASTDISSNQQWLSNLIHTDLKFDNELVDYPSHLHIDLLPRAQKQGQGKALMGVLWQALKIAGSTGVHLGVSKENVNAVGFYKKIGFIIVQTHDSAFIMAKAL